MTFEAASGRRLGISGLGEPASTRVAVLCHTAPGTGSVDPDPIASAESGLRIVGIDRPGYGGSDRCAGEPHLEQWVDDVRDYLGELDPSARRSSGVDIEIVAAIGIGYGAFYAAALAAAHATCPRLIVIEPAAPPARSEPLDDPTFHELEATDPMSGATDRQEIALAQGGGYGEAADHLLLADAGWGGRVHDVDVPTDLIGAPDDPGTAWWRHHLHRPTVHELVGGGGLPELAQGWRIALGLLAEEED